MILMDARAAVSSGTRLEGLVERNVDVRTGGARYKVYERICTSLYDLLVAVGSRASHAISREASSTSRHFVARARMGLRGGVRARIDTTSTTVYRSLDAVVRKKSRVLTPAASRVRKLSLFFRRMYLWRLDAQRLLGFACRLHG